MYYVGDMDNSMKVAIFFTIKSFVRYKQGKCLVKPNVFVCAKVFIFYNAVKPFEICATKAKYLNQCITPRKMRVPVTQLISLFLCIALWYEIMSMARM